MFEKMSKEELAEYIKTRAKNDWPLTDEEKADGHLPMPPSHNHFYRAALALARKTALVTQNYERYGNPGCDDCGLSYGHEVDCPANNLW